MSTTFHAWCETHEVEGPRIQRSAGGAALWDQWDGEDRWAVWLLKHEYCQQRLLHEGAATRLRGGIG